MNASLVYALANYLSINLVVYLIKQHDLDSLEKELTGPMNVQTSWYTEYGEGIELADNCLIVCKNEIFCKQLFEMTDPPKRKNIIFLMNNNQSSNVFAGIRYDDTILTVNQSTGNIKEVCGFKKNTYQLEFGKWNYSTETLTASKLSKWERRTDMQGAKLRTAILHWFPVSINLTQPDSPQPTWGGFMIDILESLQYRLNFTMEFTSPEDRVWGRKVFNTDGSFSHYSGLVGELVYKRADVCASGLSQDIDRSRVIDFSLGLLPTPYTLIVKSHASDSSQEEYLSYRSYTTIFRSDVWVILAAIGLLFSLCLKLSFYCFGRNEFSYIGTLSMFGLALIQKNSFLDFPQRSLTFMQFHMSLFGMLVFFTYTCDLTAEVTVGQSDKFPDNFEQLLDEEYTIFVEKGGLQVVIVEEALKRLSKNAFGDSVYLYDYPSDWNMDPVIQKLLSRPKQAFFGTALDLARDNRLKVLNGFHDAVLKFANLAFQKDSEITDLFNFHLNKMVQSGVLDKIKKRWIDDDKPENDMSQRIFVDDGRQIGPKSMTFPGSILVASTLAAFLVLITEICRNRFEYFRKNRDS